MHRVKELRLGLEPVLKVVAKRAAAGLKDLEGAAGDGVEDPLGAYGEFVEFHDA
jgi:hypothetical protein